MAAMLTRTEWEDLRRQASQSMPCWMEAAGLNDLTRLPDVLLAYQQQLLASTATHRVVVVEKSRRTGYTWAVAADAVLSAAASRQAGGMNVYYMGYNLEMARDFIDVSAMWARGFGPVASEVEEFIFDDTVGREDRSIKAFRITFASGYSIVALPSFARSLRGKQGYVILDEAAFHDELAEVLKAALALLMWGGKVLVISTHDGDDNPFNALCEDIRKQRRPYQLITLDFDQALRDGLYQRICLVTGQAWSPEAEAAWREEIISFYGDAADEELYVIPAAGSGTYIPPVLIEKSQRRGIPVVRLDLDASFLELAEHLRQAEIHDWCERELKPLLASLTGEFRTFFGMDFAMSGDLSVIWPVQLLADMTDAPPFVVELRAIGYAAQKQILWYILDRLPRFIGGCMDATGNGGPLAQETATRYGQGRIAEVKISEGWYREKMPLFKAAFESFSTATPADTEIYNDHRSIKLVRGVPQVVRQPKDGGKGEAAAAAKGKKKQRHGDSAIAHLMAFLATRMEAADWDAFEAAGQLRQALGGGRMAEDIAGLQFDGHDDDGMTMEGFE
jgi:phage FluMu gp28-like protein